MKTKIRETRHYTYRVTVSQRIKGKDLTYANKTFHHIIKRVKNGRITPRNGNTPGTLSVLYKGLVFVYKPNQDGTFTIITCYDRNQQQPQEGKTA